MKTLNPATGEILREYPEHGAAEVERRLAQALVAYKALSRTSFDERGEKLRRAAKALRDGLPAYARLMTEEMGKTIVSAEAEAEKCAWVCEYYAEHAERFLSPERVASDAAESLVRFDPLGPILAVMPWNFPFWQVFRFAAPALMAGNVGLLKHASNVPGCALAIEDIFRRAGFPEGAFSALLIPSSQVEAVIRHPAVQAVTLTGSEPAGRSVAATAGAALKKTVLELGGSDPFLVLADADVPSAASFAAKARAINNGQSCIAAKRFIVEERVAPAFEQALSRAMESLKVGDPMDRATDVGPITREDLLEELHGQVTRAVGQGAKLLTGGRRLAGEGYFYAPTVLAGVEPGMSVFDEETFGPVAAVTRAKDAQDAVRLANLSRFGLGASVWTSDPQRGKALAREIEAGMVFVNGVVKSDPKLPFGGVKASGYGRELGSFGIREFVNIKAVWVR